MTIRCPTCNQDHVARSRRSPKEHLIPFRRPHRGLEGYHRFWPLRFNRPTSHGEKVILLALLVLCSMLAGQGL